MAGRPFGTVTAARCAPWRAWQPTGRQLTVLAKGAATGLIETRPGRRRRNESESRELVPWASLEAQPVADAGQPKIGVGRRRRWKPAWWWVEVGEALLPGLPVGGRTVSKSVSALVPGGNSCALYRALGRGSHSSHGCVSWALVVTARSLSNTCALYCGVGNVSQPSHRCGSASSVVSVRSLGNSCPLCCAVLNGSFSSHVLDLLDQMLTQGHGGDRGKHNIVMLESSKNGSEQGNTSTYALRRLRRARRNNLAETSSLGVGQGGNVGTTVPTTSWGRCQG